MEAFAERMQRQDPRTGAVGLVGAWFNPKAGRLRRVPDTALVNGVAVDYVGGGQVPLPSRGHPRRRQFSGGACSSRSTTWSMGCGCGPLGTPSIAAGPLWQEERRRQGRLGLSIRPKGRVLEPSWRRYCGLEEPDSSMLHTLRPASRRGAASHPGDRVGRACAEHLFPYPGSWLPSKSALNARACCHAWSGRMGETVEPGEMIVGAGGARSRERGELVINLAAPLPGIAAAKAAQHQQPPRGLWRAAAGDIRATTRRCSSRSRQVRTR